MDRSVRTYLIFFAVLSSMISACSIEKRHYMRGYHVTFFSNHKVSASLDKSPSLCDAADLTSSTQDSIVPIQSEHSPSPEFNSKNSEILLVQDPAHQDVHEINKRRESLQLEVSENEVTVYPTQTNAQVHPAAAGSLLFGILSALCFVGLFISSFSPLGLVIGLIIGLFAFAILAKKLSKRAFEDMHHARNRYSGRAFAAAGLTLSVITIVAFIGLLAVMIFGIAFISLA